MDISTKGKRVWSHHNMQKVGYCDKCDSFGAGLPSCVATVHPLRTIHTCKHSKTLTVGAKMAEPTAHHARALLLDKEQIQDLYKNINDLSQNKSFQRKRFSVLPSLPNSPAGR